MTSMHTASAPSAAAPRDIDAATLERWLSAGECLLVDVREPDEHARERIAGARLVPLSRFDPSAIGARPGQRVVLHCKSGRRSADAMLRLASLEAAGIPVHSLVGGIEAWKSAGKAVATDTSVSRLSIMRQVQLVIGILTLTGCALAWFVHPAFIALPAFLGAGLTFAGATGTCGLASLLAAMPWNRAAATCSTGRCG